MADKKSIASLFGKGASALGLNDESSSIIIANLNGGTVPLCGGSPFDEDEGASDDSRIIMLVVDRSPSMEGVEEEVRNGVNEILVPALLGGAAQEVGILRMGGISFSCDRKPLWGNSGFVPIKDLPKLDDTLYSTRRGSGTALHQAILDGVTALTAYALDVRQKTGSNPECVLAVLSDGANNDTPHDEDPVYQVVSRLSPELFTTIFIGFETFERVDFRTIANALGFREVWDLKKQAGEDEDGLKRRFRHMMGVFSSQLVKRASSSMVGTKAAKGASTGFWEN